MMLEVLSGLSWQGELLPVPLVDIRELLCWWSQLRGYWLKANWMSFCYLVVEAFQDRVESIYCTITLDKG